MDKNNYILFITLIIILIIINLYFLFIKKKEHYGNAMSESVNKRLNDLNNKLNDNTDHIDKTVENVDKAIINTDIELKRIKENDYRNLTAQYDNAVNIINQKNIEHNETIIANNEKIRNQQSYNNNLQNLLKISSVLKYGYRFRIRHKNGPSYLSRVSEKFEKYTNKYSEFQIVGKPIGTPVKYGDIFFIRNIFWYRPKWIHTLQHTNNGFAHFANNNTGPYERLMFENKDSSRLGKRDIVYKNTDLYIRSARPGRNRYLQLWGTNLPAYSRFYNNDKKNNTYWKTFKII
jgi:hypothetical protein